MPITAYESRAALRASNTGATNDATRHDALRPDQLLQDYGLLPGLFASHRVVACQRCAAAVWPEALLNHLRGKAHVLTLLETLALCGFGLGIADDPSFSINSRRSCICCDV